MLKRYIIRKFVMAESAEQAIKQEKRAKVDDAFLDTDWLAEHTRAEAQMGFQINPKTRNDKSN